MKTVKIYSNTVGIKIPPIEMFKKTHNIKGNTVTSKNLGVLDISWLKSASKAYNISSDIRDYVVVPNPVVTTNLPNVNMQAFDKNILLEFDLTRRRPRYKTFVGTPTHIEHKNSDVKEAKGVNLDASIVKINKYNLAKIIVLSAFDRTKDPYLCKTILNNKINGFSMGATTSGYICSICSGLLGPGIKYKTCHCDMDYNNLLSYGNVINGKLQYLIAYTPVFFENSWVENPADISATSTEIF